MHEAYRSRDQLTNMIAHTMESGLDPNYLLEAGGILSVLMQATKDSCNLDMLVQAIDSRMSNLDFTLGIFTNVFS